MIFRRRSHEPELLDLGPSHYTEEEYVHCLSQLERIGHLLGGNRAAFSTLSRLPPPSSLLDVGCGDGHFTLSLARQFPHAQVTGIDISPQAIELAQRRLEKAPVDNVVFSLVEPNRWPYPPNHFDIVTATLVCHHFSDDALIDFLRNSYRTASKYVLLNDLHRHWLAYLSFALIAKPLFRNRLIYHDGLLSIKRAFKKRDWIALLTAAEIPLERCSITWHWAFRWIVCINAESKSTR